MTLSEHPTIAIAIAQRIGRRSVPVGTLVRAGAGPRGVRIAFSGKIGGVALSPGSYTATLTAIDGAGNRSASRAVRFTVPGS